MIALNHDVLLHIVEHLKAQEDYASLFHCSLVNKAFGLAASQLLYQRIVLSPRYTRSFRLGRQDQELTDNWISASLPSNASFVRDLRVIGFLVERGLPQNNFEDVLRDSIRTWVNLNNVTFSPRRYHPDVFTNALIALKECQFLRHLTVDTACCDELRTSLLVQLNGLETLSINNPGRAVLSALPDWLSRLSSSLRNFHLTGNCGSVTPGVLKSFLPHVRRIRSFALGLSYSITDDDAFSFLEQLKSLASLDIRHYVQLRAPGIQPNLLSLQSLTVRHASLTTRQDGDYLTKWIRRLSGMSPLETLELIEDSWYNRGPCIGLDGLLHHICSKHWRTLKVLELPRAFVGLTTLREVCNRCEILEEISIGTTKRVFDSLRETFSPCKHIHTMSLFTPMSKANKVNVHVDSETISLLFGTVPPLRRLYINTTLWEGSWLMKEDEQMQFVIQQGPSRQWLEPTDMD